MSLLQSGGLPEIAALLAPLINELSALSQGIVLVLDDYHVIDDHAIQDGMAFLLDHLPPALQLVIATRADPALPLARLRARGELVEIRAADLRFTPDEATAYLNEAMGLTLTAGDVAALEWRTEGWIAGLQLAALSLQGRDDVASFIAGFAGDDRYIIDYLVEEVLQRQSDIVRDFLLETSILDRLSGPLCDAVTGRNDGRAMLETLERGNLFIVPLDDRRRWFRYHHLFADVLSTHLLAERTERVAALHQRASEWYEAEGLDDDAIHHAFAARDFERAARLVELAEPEMRRTRQESTLLDWFEALPDEVLRRRPVLSAVYGSVLLAMGKLEDVDARLRDAERWLETTETAGMVVVDEAEFRHLPGSIAVWRAGLALVRGDLAGTVSYARRALDLLPEENLLERGGATALMGLAFWAGGDLEAAHQTFAAGMARVQRAGYTADTISSAIALAEIDIARGRLHEAMHTYERAVRLATEHGAPRGTADVYAGMSRMYLEWNDLDAAEQYLQQSEELAGQAGLPLNRYRGRVARARLQEARGDLDGALGLLNEAERLYAGDFFPNVRPIPALKARVWIAQGKLGQAHAWAGEQGLSVEDHPTYLREFEHITLARILLASAANDREDRSIREAEELLARLLGAAEDGKRNGSVIEILVLQAIAHRLRGDVAAALAPLERALTLASPEGYVRVFVDEGPPMAALLEHAAKRGIATDYVRGLLGAFGKASPAAPVKQGLVEPLSQRELEVLRLLRSELDGPDIARELVVALSTVRTHTKSIYSKLGVTSRRAAVKRAEELGLL
jgi:LuxR family maltose regulon positive regulatory protein